MDQDQGTQPPGAGTPPPPPPSGGTPPPPPPSGGTPPTGGQGQGTPPPPPPGGATPAGATPVGGQGQAAAGAQAGAAGAKGDESYLRPRPPDSELGIGSTGDFATTIAVPPHPNTTFDEAYFLKMLSGSISLTKNEKAKIVESVSKLSQYQIDELIKIFEEERRKFAELDEKHQVKIRELQNKQTEDWKDLEMTGKQEAATEKSDAEAAKLREQLMAGKGAAAAVAKKCPKCEAEITDEKATECPKCGAALE